MSLIGCNNQNQTTKKILKEQYELQDKCGKRSEEWFKKEYESTEGNTNYKNHYDKKENKCFILLTSFYTNKKGGSIQLSLYDINEDNEYGVLIIHGYNVNNKPYSCSVLNKSCGSYDEWLLLVNPYMED